MNKLVGATVALSAALGLAAGVLISEAVRAAENPITRTELLDVELTGLPGKVAHLYTIELAPDVLSPRHWHPGHYFAYIIEGTGEMLEVGKPPMLLQPGTPYYIYSEAGKPAYWHGQKNTSKSKPLKMVVVLIGDKGQPITRFE